MTVAQAAPSADPLTPAAPAPTLLTRIVELRWIRRHEWALLIAIAAIGAVARLGFSSGTLYRDDAWVALTSRVSLSTAARMVVTTPGFVLAERVWIGWFPHSVALDQLPTYIASVLGIVAVGRLARWWGLSAPAALVAAGIVAVAYSDVQYATRVKPYAFDLLGAVLVLWLAEKVRRENSRAAPWLACASIAVCAFSLTPVPLVVGVWAALGIDAIVRRRLDLRLAISGAATALGLGALWLALRGGISPRLKTSWNGYYLVVSSVHGLTHTSSTIVDGLVRGIGVTTPSIGVPGLGTLDRAGLIVLGIVGLVAWRRQLLSIAAVLGALVLTVPSLVPLGTGRTDAYLYPALAMLVAEGATVVWHLVRRAPAQVAAVVLCASVVFAGLLAVDRVVHRPSYPGGNFAIVAAIVHDDLAKGEDAIIGGTARWPWAYYDVHTVRIVHSDLYNNGYTPLSDNRHVIVIPGSAIEGGYLQASRHAAAVVKNYCGGIVYVESNDWPSMPMTLLATLESTGKLGVVSGPIAVGGYRYWNLTTGAPCAPPSSVRTRTP